MISIKKASKASAGYNWGELEDKTYAWEPFSALGLSWAGFEALAPDYLDPGTGYIWEDIEKAKFIWQTLADKRPSWQEWQEFLPGGNWEDSLAIFAAEGDMPVLQVNALNVPAAEGITFVIVYDPAAVSWEGFPQEKIGLVVSNPLLLRVASHENGELKLHFPIASEEPWTGIITLLGFHAKKAGTLTFALKGGS